MIDQIDQIQRGILRRSQIRIRIPGRQKGFCKLLPVFLRAGVNAEKELGGRGGASGGEFPAGVEVQRVVDSPFFQTRHQIVERIQLLRIECGGRASALCHQEIFKMVEADGVAAGSGDLFGELFGLLLREIVCRLAEIDAEKPDPFSRIRTENKMSFFICDDPSIFSRRRIKRSGKVERRPLLRMPGEGNRQPLLSRSDDLLSLLCSPFQSPVGERRCADHPDRIPFRFKDQFGNRFSAQTERRGVQPDARFEVVSLPGDCGVAERFADPPVSAVDSGADRDGFPASIRIADLDRSDRFPRRRRPCGGVKKMEIAERFPFRDPESRRGGKFLLRTGKNQTASAVVPGRIRNPEFNSGTEKFSGGEGPQIVFRTLIGPSAASVSGDIVTEPHVDDAFQREGAAFSRQEFQGQIHFVGAGVFPFPAVQEEGESVAPLPVVLHLEREGPPDLQDAGIGFQLKKMRFFRKIPQRDFFQFLRNFHSFSVQKERPEIREGDADLVIQMSEIREIFRAQNAADAERIADGNAGGAEMNGFPFFRQHSGIRRRGGEFCGFGIQEAAPARHGDPPGAGDAVVGPLAFRREV